MFAIAHATGIGEILMRIVTFNANGIRSAASKGFYQWMAESAADVVCIQELKAQGDQLTEAIFSPEGYVGYFDYAEKKGYSGVGIYTRTEPEDAKIGIGWPDFDSEGRFIRIDYAEFSIISIYLPSGSSGDIRQKFKEEMLERMKAVVLDFRTQDRDFILCGDLNIAHKPIDLRNWKGNRRNSGFLPQERAWMDWLIDTAGYVDAFRVVDTRPGQYTWWSNRGQAYAKNVGWRLDYQIVTPAVQQRILSAFIFTQTKFSDHAPLVMDYDFAIEAS